MTEHSRKYYVEAIVKPNPLGTLERMKELGQELWQDPMIQLIAGPTESFFAIIMTRTPQNLKGKTDDGKWLHTKEEA